MPGAKPARKTAEYVWLNGGLVRWEDATIHVTTVGASAHLTVFEGIKAYRNPETDELAVFRLDAHLKRLFNSMKLVRMRCPWTLAELAAATFELLRANGTREDTYIRPVAFFSGLDVISFADTRDQPPEVLIWTRPFTSHLGTGRALSCAVSSWTHISDNVMPPRIKTMSNYQNKRLAEVEARVNGYDSAILLSPQGKVAEGPGAAIFLVRDGVAVTPPVTAGILESITRDSVLRILREALGVPVEVREVDRTELYLADEAFFCGTAAEITAITSIDRLPVGTGEIGPITRALDRCYTAAVRGLDPRFAAWRQRDVADLR